MKSTSVVSIVAVFVMASMANAATVWDPFLNPVQTPPFNWNDPANWTNGVPQDSGGDLDPAEFGKAVFNVFDSDEAVVTDAQVFWKLVQGDGGDGGVLRVMNGGSLTTTDTEWSAVGYDDGAQMIVETGGTASFGGHLWVGFQEGFGTATVDVDGGTLNVANVLGLNWGTDGVGVGADSVVNVTNNGILNVPGRLDLGNQSGLGTLNVNSGGVVNAANMKNDGTIVVGNGGQLITPAGQWVSVGQRSTGGTLTVETGGTADFGQHLWVGMDPGSIGTVDIDGGTVSVGAMLGLGWLGGTGFINVNDGGVLDLFQLHGDGTSSMKNGSELDITGTGEVHLPGNYTAVINAYIANGSIFGNGVLGNVNIDVSPLVGEPGDFDSDGDVDGNDFLEWQIDPNVGVLVDWVENLGKINEQTVVTALPVPAISAVPEPAALTLVLTGAFVLCGSRRRRR